MIIKLEDRNQLINKAKHFMKKYSLNAFEAIILSEYEMEKQIKTKGIENE